MKNIIDADWTPSQRAAGIRAATRYLDNNAWKREAKKTVRVQRFFLFALALLIVVMAVALAVAAA